MKYLSKCIFLCFLGFSFFACKSDKPSQQEKPDTSTIVPKDSIKVDAYEQFETVEIADFIKKVETSEKAMQPEEIMKLYYPGNVEGEEGNQSINIESKALSDTHSEVTLVHNNLLDDSMKALKLVMRLQKKEDKWSVITLQKNWQCRQGRGHTDWGIGLCN